MQLIGSGFTLRPFREGDEAALVRHGNDRAVWINMTNFFPHPYTPEAAASWVVRANCEPETAATWPSTSTARPLARSASVA